MEGEERIVGSMIKESAGTSGGAGDDELVNGTAVAVDNDADEAGDCAVRDVVS